MRRRIQQLCMDRFVDTDDFGRYVEEKRAEMGINPTAVFWWEFLLMLGAIIVASVFLVGIAVAMPAFVAFFHAMGG
jgi:hypothetical protein